MHRLKPFLKQPVAMYSILAELTGCVTGGLFLSQALYWTRRSKKDGWFWKSREEWERETALRRAEQERARSILRTLGVLEEREDRLNHRMFYRVNVDNLAIALESGTRVPRPSRGDVSNLRGCGKPTSPVADDQPPSNGTEITSESTPDATSASVVKKAKKAKTPPHPEHAQFVADWIVYWGLRNKGAKCPFGPRDAKAAKQLLAHFETMAATKAFIKACHARAKEGFPFSNTTTLYDIANGLARLIDALGQPAKINGHHRGPAPKGGAQLPANQRPRGISVADLPDIEP